MSGGFSNNNINFIPSKLTQTVSESNTNKLPHLTNFISPFLTQNANATDQALSILQQFNQPNLNMNNLAFSVPYQQIFQPQEPQQQLQNSNGMLSYPYQFPFLFSFQSPISKLNNEPNLNDMVNNIMTNQSNSQSKVKCVKEQQHHKSSNHQLMESFNLQRPTLNLDTISGLELEKKLIYQ